MNLPPFIVTLGTFSIFTAVSLLYAAGQTIALGPGRPARVDRQDAQRRQREHHLGRDPDVAALPGGRASRCATPPGDDICMPPATTGRPPSSPASTPTACCSAPTSSRGHRRVAAWIVCGRVGGADPNAGLNYNLQSITAVVIGGTSLFGGRGLVVGSLIGALIVQVFNSGLALAGVDPNYQVLATGHPGDPRGLRRPVDQEGQGMSETSDRTVTHGVRTTTRSPSSRPRGWSSCSAGSSGCAASTCSCTPARCWP